MRLTLPLTVEPEVGFVSTPLGGVVSILSGSAAATALLLPAVSKVAALIGWTPSDRLIVLADHRPVLSLLAPPIPATPLSYMTTPEPGTVVPVTVGLGNIVVLSPLIPESLNDARTGVEGAGGATVSTEKLNGVTAPAEFGEISLPVRRWAPSLSATVG